MKSGKVLLGVLAGVAAGAVLGILFAPDQGAKTRKKIINKGGDYADGLKEKFEQFVNGVKEKYNAGSEVAEEIIAKGKAKYDEAEKEFQNGKA